MCLDHVSLDETTRALSTRAFQEHEPASEEATNVKSWLRRGREEGREADSARLHRGSSQAEEKEG